MDTRDTGWERSRCANAHCSGGTMWVSRSQRQADLWFVRVGLDRRRYVEVAQAPFCPSCSQDLVPAIQPALTPLGPAMSMAVPAARIGSIARGMPRADSRPL